MASPDEQLINAALLRNAIELLASAPPLTSNNTTMTHEIHTLDDFNKVQRSKAGDHFDIALPKRGGSIWHVEIKTYDNGKYLDGGSTSRFFDDALQVTESEAQYIIRKAYGYAAPKTFAGWPVAKTYKDVVNALEALLRANGMSGTGTLKVQKKTAPEAIVDFSKALDPVVLPQETKDSICSVLTQFNFRDLIFSEWGLGEVIEYGRGMTLLMHGAPGTGKTYAAHCIAKALGKELDVVDTARIQSPFPGEMERQLCALFEEAKKKDSVIFMDECDGLIQEREGMGQILSAENNTLLREIEKYEGILVMATNRVGALDSALERRLSLIIEFKLPDEKARQSIWEKHLPEKLPLNKDVDAKVLAKEELSGGQIKNVILGAVRYATLRIKKASDVKTVNITLEDFEKAIDTVMDGKDAFSKKETIGRGGRSYSAGKTMSPSRDIERTRSTGFIDSLSKKFKS